MFRTFARALPNGANDLVQFHPSDLTAVLELAWDRRFQLIGAELGHPFHRSDLFNFSTTWFGFRALTPPAPPPPALAPGQPDLNTIINRINRAAAVFWDHLIYAYMIENTRIYEIFRRVIQEFVHGEKLGVPARPESQRWLRVTEELFYRDPPPFFITAVSSHVRPDIQATRRNAYQRMFGMDLNHGSDDSKAYPYVKAEAANNEFVSTFEELLREVWIGMENVNNTSGAKPTDDAKIADIAQKLFNMLRTRRQTGNLSREEFVFVSMLSWFHLTVEGPGNLPIVEDLRAQASSAEQRLFKIAQRVGLPAHGLSQNYFDIADSISLILLEIETGIFNNSLQVPALYTPPTPSEAAMRTIIRHWSIITGKEMKARKVTPS
jgi:hypothetical protein